MSSLAMAEQTWTAAVEVTASMRPGEVRRWTADNGEVFRLLTIPDRDERPMCLPMYREDVGAGMTVPNDLRERGVQKFVDVPVDEETRIYFERALTKLPVVLAVQATFNMHERPNLDDFPDGYTTPIIGIVGPPWSGKTFLLLSTSVLEDDNSLGVRDLDPFGIESISNCREDVLRKAEGNSDFGKRFEAAVKVILGVYREKRKQNIRPNIDGITLRNELTKLLEEYRGGNSRRVYVVDLPGVGSNSAPLHIFQLLRWAMPVMDIDKAVREDEALRQVLEERGKVPMEEKYGRPGDDGVTSAAIYFIKLRQVAFNPAGRGDGHSLLSDALAENWVRQVAALRLVAAEKVEQNAE